MGRFSWIIGELGQSHHKVLRGERGGRRGRGGGWGWEQGSGRATSEAGPTFGTHAAPLPHFGLYASRTVQWCACGLSAFVVVQLLSHVWLFVTPWTATCQASLSLTVFWSLPRFMYIELMMLSNQLILYCSLLLFPSVFPSIKVFFNESAFTLSGQGIGGLVLGSHLFESSCGKRI